MLNNRLPNDRPNITLAPFGNAVTTISRLSTANQSHADIIFRCQGCTAVGGTASSIFDASKASMTLKAVVSDNMPIYLGKGMLANLYLDGAEETQFVMNLTAARSANYASLLQAAGFSG